MASVKTPSCIRSSGRATARRPPLSTWEPAENIHPEVLAEYEAGLEAEAQLDAEEAAELEGEDE